MLLGSYKPELAGIGFDPYKFQGHGWLYSHESIDQREIKNLKDAGAFEVSGQKKKSGQSFLEAPPLQEEKKVAVAAVDKIFVMEFDG